MGQEWGGELDFQSLLASTQSKTRWLQVAVEEPSPGTVGHQTYVMHFLSLYIIVLNKGNEGGKV